MIFDATDQTKNTQSIAHVKHNVITAFILHRVSNALHFDSGTFDVFIRLSFS